MIFRIIFDILFRFIFRFIFGIIFRVIFRVTMSREMGDQSKEEREGWDIRARTFWLLHWHGWSTRNEFLSSHTRRLSRAHRQWGCLQCVCLRVHVCCGTETGWDWGAHHTDNKRAWASHTQQTHTLRWSLGQRGLLKVWHHTLLSTDDVFAQPNSSSSLFARTRDFAEILKKIRLVCLF